MGRGATDLFSLWQCCLDAWLWLWLRRMGPFPKTRGGGLEAGTRQQGELGLLGGVHGPDDLLQSRGQQARRATSI